MHHKNVSGWSLTIAALIASLALPAHAAPKRIAPLLTPAVVNNARLAPLVGPHGKGAAVLRAQILLERAHFSVGEIDAAYGSNMRQALIGYQKAQGLPATGRVDPPTWAALNRDRAPALVSYTLADEDVAGPFEPIPEDMMEKAQLKALGYASALEGLGEKFRIKPALLQKLNRGQRFDRAGADIVVPSINVPLPPAASIVIDKSDSTLTLLDAAGRTVAQFPASTGSEHDPLPIGDWTIQTIAPNPVFHYNPDLFWDGDPSHTKAEIPPGPNNPVGVVWMDLSKEHYGIHGTPEPSLIGKTQSHGCIRLTNWHAAMVSKAIEKGTPAFLTE